MSLLAKYHSKCRVNLMFFIKDYELNYLIQTDDCLINVLWFHLLIPHAKLII